jgi:hypothetical protein
MAKVTTRWYPRTLAERAAWHFNFTMQAQETGASDGLTVGQVTQIAGDAAAVAYFNDFDQYLEQEKKNWRAARDAFLDGDQGAAEPPMPTFNVPALPADAVIAIAERTERYADKIKAADNYSPAVGAAYGIVSPPAPDVPVADKKPAAKVSTGGEFKATFKIPLQGMSGVQMQMTRDGDAVTHKTNFPSGDITDETAPLVAGKPETRQYRFYFLQKNQIVGESSDIYEVTVHP